MLIRARTLFERLLKRLLIAAEIGNLFSARPELLPLDLERDYPDIDALFVGERWPFLRSDLEISLALPKATAFVARKDGKFAAFFICHHFGDVGYLDMGIINPSFRGSGIGRPLYFKTLKAMKAKGLRSFVVHTTQDSARLFRLLRFRSGQTFTFLVRSPGGVPPSLIPEDEGLLVRELDTSDGAQLVALDATLFGIERPEWIGGLLRQPSTRFFELSHVDQPAAFLCLRARRDGAFSLSGAGSRPAHVIRLFDHVVRKFSGYRLECHVRMDSELHEFLLANGFVVPEIFRSVLPLTEWRKGPTGSIGTSPALQTLTWF
jgi:ribosomal protein S18 acetylase RimI-like enzyme